MLTRHDGIPVFGLYAGHKNKVSVTYTLDGKSKTETHEVYTSPLKADAIDNRNLSIFHEVKVKEVKEGFEDRLYLVNSHSYLPQGADVNWTAPSMGGELSADGAISMGSATFDMVPMLYIVDTQGEYRWWMERDAVHDYRGHDLEKRGYFMGINETKDGLFTYVQGQRFGLFDLMGRFKSNPLPRGYADTTHAMFPMENGNFLVRASKQNYRNPEGDLVHTVRDHILEVSPHGDLVDVWVLPEILDPYRDALLYALDMGAVCANVDMDRIGETMDSFETDAPYGDLAGIGAGRNWAHVNSISHDPSDDSIILSLRHQGNVKIGRDKEVKWILAPREGWTGKFADKVLTPVDANGKPINCTVKGKCEGDFDFTYTQHTTWLSSKGTITSLDNGDGRWHEQPVMPTDKWTRVVEYKVNEEDMTVEQIWEYGKERGYEWYSPITSNTEYRPDRDTMFSFNGSIQLFEPGKPTIGRFNEIDYKTKEVMVEIDVYSEKANQTHYRGVLVTPQSLFGF
ncbi:aryl-sulfate sulfotransferase [Ferrimonas pelagia]|uniref:Aryl-sulfate sulfotransferase n=2 Tax=Ferrimonas pelagia TaxID=1177826 RepID=A0ABP9EJA4_9GAMM